MAKIRLVAKMGPKRPVLTPFIAGSFLVHATIATLVMFAPAVKGGKRGIPNAIPVSIVALPGPKPKPRVKTGTVPDKPKPKPEEKKSAPAPDQLPEKAKEKRPDRPDPEIQEAETDEPGVVASEDDTEEPLFQGEGDGDGSSAVASLDILGSEFAWYNSSVTSKLTVNWKRPLLGNVNETLTVVVAFKIRKDGSVTDVEILTGSGVPSVDRSVLRAVYDAAPLPKIPPQLSKNMLPARFEFRWHPKR
jgi:TonB family protein